MKFYDCCCVCGEVFERKGLRGGVLKGEQVPTANPDVNFVVCSNRPSSSSSQCRLKLEAEINRLIREEGYQGLVGFPEKPSMDDPCSHPARRGRHEVYLDATKRRVALCCRACGAQAIKCARRGCLRTARRELSEEAAVQFVLEAGDLICEECWQGEDR